jgi:PAS domain S-box-containing protein
MACILILDEPASQARLAEQLSQSGHDIVVDSGSAHELARARGAPPDLLIVRLGPPEWSGYAIAQQARGEPELSQLKIMFTCTDEFLAEARALAAACGVAYVLPATADPAELRATIAAALASPPGPPTAEPTYPQLLATAERFRSLIEGAPDLIQRVAPNGHLLYANRAWRQALGYTADRLPGLLWDIVAPDERQASQDLFARVLAGEALPAAQITYVRNDGQRVVLEGSITAETVEGRVVATQAFLRDITARQQAEPRAQELDNRATLSMENARLRAQAQSEQAQRQLAEQALQEGQEQLRRALAYLPECAIYQVEATVDGARRFTYVSDNLQQLCGVAAADALRDASKLYGLIPPTMLAEVAAAEEISRQKQTRFRIDVPMRLPDGTTHWFRLSSAPRRQPDGSTIWDGTMIDIDERMRAEQALRESEAKFRLLSEQSLLGIAIIQHDRIQYVNDAVGQINGYSPTEMLNWSQVDFARLIHSDDLAFATEQVAKKQRGDLDAITSYAYRLRAKDGAIKWVEQFSKTIQYGGQPADLVTLVDITARKLAEMALRESEARFRQLAEHLPHLVWTATPAGSVDYLNQRWLDYAGAPNQALIGDGWAAYVHPDDRDYAKRRWNAAIAAALPDQAEFRFRRHDGAYRWFKVRVAPLRDESGQVVQWVGSNSDIDEAHALREALRSANRALRMLSDCNQQLIRATDEHMLLAQICQIVVEMGGYQLAWVGYAESNAERSVRVVAQHGFDNGYLDAAQISWAETERGHGPTGTAIRTGQIAINHDVSLDPLFAPWREQAQAHGFGASIGLPINIGGTTIGALSIYAAQPDAFDAPETALLLELTDDLSYGIATLRARAAHAQAQVALAQSERRYAALIAHAWEAIVLFEPGGQIRYASPTTTRMLGYSVDELVGLSAFELIHPDDHPAVSECVTLALARPDTMVPVAARVRHKNGEQRYLEGMINNLIHDEAIGALVNNLRDVTDQRRLQEQFLQAQKMEVVGRLVGGVAHDFNNLITAIQGMAELSLHDRTLGAQTRADLREIQRASGRAATLTRQLLTFARQQPLELRSVDLNALIDESVHLLRRLVGADIELIVVPGPRLRLTRADPAQIEQVIVNLAVNARDAMPGGGRLTIETANVELDKRYTDTHASIVAGDYVMLAVSDTGTGMPPEVAARALEPFFTTKGQQKGTGLGLSTCYGIITQHQGYIQIYSEVGRGTSIKCYLPALLDIAAAAPDALASQALPGGNETILLVEDEPQVRAFARRVLEPLGYTVLEARNGVEALGVARAAAGQIALLVTDVTMPLMSGVALVEQYRASWPPVKVLYLSGYTDATIVHPGVQDQTQHFLQKPFTSSGLAQKVRQVLDAE